MIRSVGMSVSRIWLIGALSCAIASSQGVTCAGGCSIGGATALPVVAPVNVSANSISNIDCTGATDSAARLTTLIAGVADGTTLGWPAGCITKLGTTVTISDRVNLGFTSLSLNNNGAGAAIPVFTWSANGGVMFDFEHDDHPAIQGFIFQCTTAIDGYLKFDGNPVSHIGTNGWVTNNSFQMCNSNPNYIGVSISPTATNNHENYHITNNEFYCTGQASVISHNGALTASSAVLNVTPDTPFNSGMVGNTIWVSYPSSSTLHSGDTYHGLIKTTISAFTSSSQVTLAVTAAVSVTGATVHLGTSYGIGIQNGASQNALQQRFIDNNFTNCDYGIRMAGGSARIQGVGGGAGNYGIFIGAFVAEGIEIDDYFSESDMRGIESDGPAGPVTITNSRMSNGQQLADGFFKFGGKVFLEGTTQEFNPPTGGVLIGDYGAGSNAYLTSMVNSFQGLTTWTTVGYSIFSVPVTSLGEAGTGWPGANVLGNCYNLSIPCVYVNNAYPPGATAVALQTNLTQAFPASETGTKVSYSSAQQCASTASPALCSDAPSGTVQVAAGATSLVINTHAVTTGSQLGCLTYSVKGLTPPTNIASLIPPYISDSSAGVSVTLTFPVAPTVNPVNLNFCLTN